MTDSGGENVEARQDLAEGIRSSRQSLTNLSQKSRLLKEQLLRLEKKLWGHKPDETVNTNG